MQEGWIKLNRQIQEHWLWKDEPFDKARAWIDLLLLANHEEHKSIYEGKLIVCKRGEVNRSISWLANRWQWNRKTVRKFLSILESDGMVVVNTTTHWTTITIVNWDFYQVDGITKRTTKGTTTGQPRDTYKNDKNEKNINNNVFTPPTLEEIKAYCQERKNDVDAKQFFDYFQAGHWIDSEGKPVRNWKQKLITWEKKGRKPQPQKAKTNIIESHDYDFNELERILSQ
jgi:hypothetical protein